MKYKQNDIKCVVEKFQKENSPTDRYASFDYCYYYFRQSSPEDLLRDMEKSCLVLGFFLSSWGMLRGSSFLIRKSVKYYEPLINYIADTNKNIWDIDAGNYNEENIKEICKIYEGIRKIIIEDKNAHLILVTKIMLGVFGFVPAFDTYFAKTFRNMFKPECCFSTLNAQSLECIKEFYLANNTEIDELSAQIFVTDFSNGQKTKLNYPKSKIIDMYGFTKRT